MYSCRGQNQLPTPQNPPKCCPIWMYDTSISSSDYVVSDDIKIFAVSLVVFKWRGGGRIAPPPSSYVSQKPIQFRVMFDFHRKRGNNCRGGNLFGQLWGCQVSEPPHKPTRRLSFHLSKFWSYAPALFISFRRPCSLKTHTSFSILC